MLLVSPETLEIFSVLLVSPETLEIFSVLLVSPETLEIFSVLLVSPEIFSVLNVSLESVLLGRGVTSGSSRPNLLAISSSFCFIWFRFSCSSF